MRASANLVQLWRASKEDLGDCVVKAEKKKKMTRVEKQTGTSLRADHTPTPRKSGFALDLGFKTCVPSKTSTLVWHLFLLENP